MLNGEQLDSGGAGLNDVRSFLGKKMGGSPSVLHFVAGFLAEDSLCVTSDTTKQKEQ